MSSLITLLSLLPLVAGSLSVSPQTEKPLPKSVDLRSRFKRWGLETRPQGQRGTCSVFTVVGALEYALAEHSKKGTALSIEFLNWAGHTVANRTIDGGFFSELWAGYEKYGICSEAEMPYQARFDRHHTPTATTQERAKANQKLPLKLQWIKEWDPNTGATEEQLTQIKRTLAQKHPVCGGFRWPKNAEWKKNTLQMCPPEQVFDGHSILLVGYKDDPKQPGGGVFLIRNSAGGSRDGAIPYDYVRAYINDAAWIREIAPREEKRQREEPTQEEQE